MSTKRMLLFIVTLCGVFVIGILMIKRNQKFDFDSITGNQSKDVAVIEPSQNADGIRWFNSLKDQYFVLYRGELGNTARRRYVMYNSAHDRLFAMTDVGNRNIVIVELHGKEKVYQGIEKE